MKCKACGSEVPEGASFCVLCGVHLETGTRANGDAPDSAVYPLLAAANLFRMRGSWDAAEQKCIEVLRLYPNNATAHSLLGDVFANQDRWGDAIQWYQLAIDLDPDNHADRAKLDQARQRVAGGQAAELAVEEAPPLRKQSAFGARFSPLMQLIVIAILSFVVVLLLMSMRAKPGPPPLRQTEGMGVALPGSTSQPAPSAGVVPPNPTPSPETGSGSSSGAAARPPAAAAPPAASGSTPVGPAPALVPSADMTEWEARVFSQLQTDVWLTARPSLVRVTNLVWHPVEQRALATVWLSQAADLREEGPRVAYRIGQVLAHNKASRFEVLVKAPGPDGSGPEVAIVADAEGVGPTSWSDDPGAASPQSLITRFRDIWWHSRLK